MNLEWGDVYEAAARGLIHQRFAPAYLHDVRGTMQALFSALELLVRSTQAGADSARLEKACDLAKRASLNHEKSTMDLFKLLTLAPAEAVTSDLNRLVLEVAHVLRNDATAKGIKISVMPAEEVSIVVDQARLQTLLVGLFAAGVDTLPAGAELQVTTLQGTDEAVIVMDSDAGFTDFLSRAASWQRPPSQLAAHDLTFLFAEKFLAGNGGRLALDRGTTGRRTLSLHYPIASFAQTRASAMEK